MKTAYNPAEFFDVLAAGGYRVQVTAVNHDYIVKIEMEKDDHYIMNCYAMRWVHNDQQICSRIDSMKDAIDMMIKQEAEQNEQNDST